uniref:Probable linoleate 9S-lipoxygenase 5 n=1 Tax=Tanacetum cinerariifolium TaxID=118510 RepID=A0A6L2J668_TANCI|nr:probable linoleate 9S-lipoxygenase 5 [Tanacetum cinerariifolium]
MGNVGKKTIEGRVVLLKKNVLDVNDLGASVLDGVHELLGQNVTLQLISAYRSDHQSSGVSSTSSPITRLWSHVVRLVCCVSMTGN